MQPANCILSKNFHNKNIAKHLFQNKEDIMMKRKHFTWILAMLCACTLGTLPAGAEETAAPAEAVTEGTDDTGSTASFEAGDSIIINNDGEAESLTVDDLIRIHSENQVRFDNKYTGARVFVTSEVKEIKTDEWLVLENASYTPKIVLHLGNGWIVSGASNALVESLNIGDKVDFAGTITGFMKYEEGVAVIYTGGNATLVQMHEEQGDDTDKTAALRSVIETYIGKRCYKDAAFWMDYFRNSYPDDGNAASLQAAVDEALQKCYLGTFIERYDSMWTCTSVAACDVPYFGEGYDYYDPVYTSDMNTYVQYLKNNGFSDAGNYSIEVNGTEDAYVALTNPDDVIVAMAQGDGFVRIIVYSKDAVYERKTTTEAQTVITDTETVRKVQEALNANGFDCGTPDGVAGNKTAEAIRAYQAANGLDQTGEITTSLLQSLGL